MRAGILGRLSSNGTVTEINEANVKDEKDAFGVLGNLFLVAINAARHADARRGR